MLHYKNDMLSKRFAKFIFARNMCWAAIGAGVVFACMAPLYFNLLGVLAVVIGGVSDSVLVHQLKDFMEQTDLEDLDVGMDIEEAFVSNAEDEEVGKNFHSDDAVDLYNNGQVNAGIGGASVVAPDYDADTASYIGNYSKKGK